MILEREYGIWKGRPLVASVEVSRWQKNGHDRLYIREADGKGRTVGYIDMKTEEFAKDPRYRVTSSDWRDAAVAAAREYARELKRSEGIFADSDIWG